MCQMQFPFLCLIKYFRYTDSDENSKLQLQSICICIFNFDQSEPRSNPFNIAGVYSFVIQIQICQFVKIISNHLDS